MVSRMLSPPICHRFNASAGRQAIKTVSFLLMDDLNSEGKLVKIVRKAGDFVQAHETVLVLETDKVHLLN